jgi:hypothetical protein
MESDRVYYLRRAAEERAAALVAPHPKAREAHLEMAAGYDLRVADLPAEDPPEIIRLVDVA